MRFGGMGRSFGRMGVAAGGGFSILDLFAGGVLGGWYDPSDLSTLFQDSAATTPVAADGDPVGCMRDKSGNGNHLLQSTDTARPIYHTDGTLHWIVGDATDDFMITSAINGWTKGSSIAGGFVSAVHGAVTNSFGVFGVGATFTDSQTSNIALCLRPNSGQTTSHRVRARFGTGDNSLPPSPALNKTVNFAMVATLDASSLFSVWIDGLARGSATASDFTGQTLNAPIRFEGLNEPCKFYGGLAVQRALSTAQVASVSAFYKTKAGVA